MCPALSNNDCHSKEQQPDMLTISIFQFTDTYYVHQIFHYSNKNLKYQLISLVAVAVVVVVLVLVVVVVFNILLKRSDLYSENTF